MAFIVEDGSGIINSNALTTVAFADEYHTDRVNDAWTGDNTAKQAAIINATDYLTKRFGRRFKGFIKFESQQCAKTVLTFTEQPNSGETITIDGNVFTFVTTVTDEDTQAEIETRPSLTIDNMATVISNSDIEFTAEEHTGLAMIISATYDGPDGNTVQVSTTTTATFSFNPLNGGNDLALPQALPFPRSDLYSPSGYLVKGVPSAVQMCIAEYALRALTSELLADPTTDATGNTITSKTEKVGPIEDSTTYATGGSTLLKSYPAADRMLAPYLKPTGGVIR